MSEDRQDPHWTRRWALPASVVAHALAIALLIFGLPISLPHPDKDQAISVDLVPPPKPQEKPKTPPRPPQEKPTPEKEKKAETPPPTGSGAPRPAPIPTLRPVFQFGDKDAGPRKSPEGGGTEDAAKASAPRNDQDKEAAIKEAQALTATR